MDRIRLLRNPIREYDWGSRTVLAELLGESSPAAAPQAELWLGAHPAAPSAVLVDSDWLSLGEWIRRDAAAVLGADVVGRFGEELPFLLKVLAVERPLSLQAHPNAAQARAGFERENAAGVPRGARHRRYPDANPKPELVCALTPFTVLCGFRSTGEILAQVDELRAHRLAALLGELRTRSDREGLRSFFEALMGLQGDERRALIADVAAAVEGGYGDARVKGWLRKLLEQHPGDPAALSPLFLNLLELQPGEALFLPAGELHAYLQGSAVEIMASSDNVLRGGMTAKHVDLSELLATLGFEARAPEVLAPREVGPVEFVYDTPAREFELAVLRLALGTPFESAPQRSIEILLCVEGEAEIEETAAGEVLRLARGSAAVVPAAAPAYRLRGEATVFWARVPAQGDRSRRR